MTALALLSACANSRDVEGLTGGASACVRCHGGLNGDTTGAPPFDAAHLTSSVAVGAHRVHVAAGYQCTACHARMTYQYDFPGHDNGTANVDFGPVAFDPDGLHTPTWSPATASCSNVYCHAPSTAPGGTGTAPGWTAGPLTCGSCHAGPGPNATDIHGGGLVVTQCNGCHSTSVDPTGLTTGTHANKTIDAVAHDANWATTSANGTTPHGLAAAYQNRAAYPTGIEGCKTCHGADLVTGIMGSIPSCDSCHTGGAAWRTSCTFCHGNAGRATDRAAPPMDASGNTTSAKVGAHLVHLDGTATFDRTTAAVSNGVACDSCHGGTSRTLPSDLSHMNGATEVTLKFVASTAVAGTYTAATGSCAATYCHGTFPNGNGKQATVSWTQTSLSGCDACHQPQYWYPDWSAATVTDGHARHNMNCAPCHDTSNTRMDCRWCHPLYNRPGSGGAPTNGAVNRTLHVNGTVDVGSSVLQINWNPTTRTCATPQCHTANGDHSGRVSSGTKNW